MSSCCLLAAKLLLRNPLVASLGISCVWRVVFLLPFSRFFLCLRQFDFNVFHGGYLWVYYLQIIEFLIFVYLQLSTILGSFHPLLFLQVISLPLSSLSGSPIMRILAYLMTIFKSIRFCLFNFFFCAPQI